MPYWHKVWLEKELIKQHNITNVRAATKKSIDGITDIRTNIDGFEQKFCFAVKEGDKELLSMLNEGLAIVISNGTFDKLYSKWFSSTIVKKSYHAGYNKKRL